MSILMKRRSVLLGSGALMLGACSKVHDSKAGESLFGAVDDWHKGLQRSLTARNALAPEFAPEDISPFFRGNGSTDPQNDGYPQHVAEGFANWRFTVGGLVERPLSLTLDQIMRLPQRTQITRHDCVEGWSAIGQWTGPQLSTFLDLARVRDAAKFIVFRCADDYTQGRYYESVDMVDAFHPQTIIAHRLNGEPLPVRNGAPLRARVERQLGYKHAKYLTGVEAVASLDDIGLGKGGYWEDHGGYQWYAGM
ncbi:MAG: molybdopterin-binding protein [Citromicrobium sp.]|nr:molybdopterin-binding protein [Citromicrobium sp.]MAO95426.1 molybdopterin-binding protein [Citromicrobium sp.]MBT47563.1 molybdopterin-binding protein [Citromicrobium sp.]|tara:strand:- start:2122 stop:2874 length:753 start_codon:yes stop_codon:yes gene_type:complete